MEQVFYDDGAGASNGDDTIELMVAVTQQVQQLKKKCSHKNIQIMRQHLVTLFIISIYSLIFIYYIILVTI